MSLVLKSDGTVDRAASQPADLADAVDALVPTVRKLAALLPQELAAQRRRGAAIVQHPDGVVAVYDRDPPSGVDRRVALIRTPAATLYFDDILQAQELLASIFSLSPVKIVDTLRAVIADKDAEVQRLTDEVDRLKGGQDIASIELVESPQHNERGSR